jgi:hypothetical protein
MISQTARHSAILLAAVLSTGFLGMAVTAYGSSFVIDNFSCADSVSLTGSAVAGPGETSPEGAGFNSSYVSCPGSLGGQREDFLLIPSGPGTSVSTIDSTGSGAITGTFGPGITEYEGMTWTGPVDLAGDFILVQIQSDSGGTLNVIIANDISDYLTFSATFAGSPSYQDVLIPLTNPTVVGTGPNLDDAPNLNVNLSLDGAGGTWTIDAVDAIATPEPSTLLLTGICFLGVLTRSLWRRSPNQ